MTAATRIALRGDLLDFTADPGWELGSGWPPGLRFRPDHWLLMDNGRIVDVHAPGEPPAGWAVVDRRGCLVTPGLIDTHVHAPQLDVIASYGAELLDWLNTYTFPAEARHADPEIARAGAARFLDALLAAGTTAAVVFPTVHRVSAEALFEGARERSMRLITGKVLMDRHAPDGLRDDVDGARHDCTDLIERWHGRGRLAYAVTPRFAATSTPAQLAMAGQLGADHPGVYLQTHVAENLAEVRWVAELFPRARSYLDVYEQHGLLHERAVLAHGIWLDAGDRALLAQRGASIAFCPSSNLFLGSGLFDWCALEAAGVHVSLASDVGGGTSLSMLRTMAAAYQVQALRGTSAALSGPDGTPAGQVPKLNAFKALYTATLGAALSLRLADEIGHFGDAHGAPTLADLAIWDWACGPVARHRLACAPALGPASPEQARALHERLFAWMTLGDERNLRETWVAGRRMAPRAHEQQEPSTC